MKRTRFKSLVVAFGLAIALLTGGASLDPASAPAKSKLRSIDAGAIASRAYLRPAGGYVSKEIKHLKSWVGVYVPPGVMKEAGWVVISRGATRGKNRLRKWDFKILARWSGAVTLYLPPSVGRTDQTANALGRHQLKKPSLIGGLRVCRIAPAVGVCAEEYQATHLSAFSSFGGAFKCFKSWGKLGDCLVNQGIKSISRGLFVAALNSVVTQYVDYDACLPFGKDNFSVSSIDILLTSCSLDPGTIAPPSSLKMGAPNGLGIGWNPQQTGNPQGGNFDITPAPSPSPPPPSPAPSPAAPPGTRGFHVADSFLGGTWARTDPGNGTWYSKSNRPANGAYWYPNGLGVGVDCARSAATYVVKWLDGHIEYWNTWLHVTDGKWFPSAAAQEIYSNGLNGLSAC